MPAAIRYPPGVMVSHLNNTFSDLACFSAEIIKAKIWFQLAVLKSRLTCTGNSESWCGLTTALMLTEHCSLLTKRRTALARPNTYTYIWHFLWFFTTTELVRTFQIMIDIFPFFFDLINTYHHPSLLVSHHLLSIPLAPEVHFLGSSCRSSYSCCQFFKVEINSPWKAISTAQGSFCCFGLHWVCSKWSNTREGEQSFRYFFCSWRQLFANALLGCEFQNNKNTSEDYKHKPKYLRTQKKHKSRQRCHHPKALKGIKSSGH